MLSRLLLATVGLAALSTAAAAADLPSRRAPPVFVPPPIPVFTWTGFYIGVNAGYAFDSNHSNSVTANDAIAAPGIAGGFVAPFARNSANGFTGGGQIGYNYELGNIGGFGGFGGGGIVVGVEADAAYTDLRKGSIFTGTGGDTTAFGSRTDYIGTVRGRLGYAFDRVLIYGTGGFAYGNANDSVTINDPALGTIYAGRRDNMRTGYAYGGGIEYALPTTSFLNFFNSSAVTVKAEFIHYDLGTSSLLVPATIPAAAGSSFTSRVHIDGNLVRAGLNFKFGDVAPVPVVARY